MAAGHPASATSQRHPPCPLFDRRQGLGCHLASKSLPLRTCLTCCRSAEPRDTGGLQQLLGLLAAEGFSLPFPVEDVPQRLGDTTVIEREGKVGPFAAFPGSNA